MRLSRKMTTVVYRHYKAMGLMEGRPLNSSVESSFRMLDLEVVWAEI